MKMRNGGNKTAEKLSSSSSEEKVPPHQMPARSAGRKRSAATLVVQCDGCQQWRIVPSKEKYDKIRENLLEQPFMCGEQGKEWKPDMSCEDPPDIEKDGSRLWVTDRPNIPLPPPGWNRHLRFRDEMSSRCADVYYNDPCGNKFRSKAEILRYFKENPHRKQGIDMSKFSFKVPKPLPPEIQQSGEAIEEGLPLAFTTQASADIEPAEPNGSSESSDDDDPSWPENVLPPKKRDRKNSK